VHIPLFFSQPFDALRDVLQIKNGIFGGFQQVAWAGYVIHYLAGNKHSDMS
jgi:hypothetical protein